jgi:sulfite exporter TauE/SafE
LNLPLLFLMGITGSLHCAGMCGPLAALAGHRGLPFYLIGKTSTYLLLGALAGALGESILRFGVGTRALAIAAGVLLLLTGLQSLGILRDSMAGVGIFARGARAMAALAGQGPAGSLVLGTANGFLPCAMTYAFVALAAATASPIQGAATMLVLGIATALPLALSTLAVRGLFRRVPLHLFTGALMLLAAAVTIYRGFAGAHGAPACH